MENTITGSSGKRVTIIIEDTGRLVLMSGDDVISIDKNEVVKLVATIRAADMFYNINWD